MLIIAGPRMTTKIDGKMQNTSGNSIFTGAFCAFSCAARRRLMRISSACARRSREIDTPKVSACSIARMNAAQLGHVACARPCARSASARVRTDADLVQHAPELVGQRAGHRGAGAVERLLEAEAGLDRDHEQVEDVGQLARDLLLALLDLAVEEHVGVR